ncbi:MAG: ScpA family protein [Rhodospirillales bacterium]
MLDEPQSKEQQELFEDDGDGPSGRQRALELVLDIEGYEGPIDVLLALARDQKVDLTHISILQLADQYLNFIATARELRLELAADYLVMASWLAYLKSRLLLPKSVDTEEPTGEQMAAALAFQLQRLEAMQTAGSALMDRLQLDQDFFPRGDPDRQIVETETITDISLIDLLRAYADQRRRSDARQTMPIEISRLYTMDQAVQRLRRMLGDIPDWRDLMTLLPHDEAGPLKGLQYRSAVASTFAASLELVREGALALRQEQLYGPIMLKEAEHRP